VVTPLRSLVESERTKEHAEIVEADIRVGRIAEDLQEEFFILVHLKNLRSATEDGYLSGSSASPRVDAPVESHNIPEPKRATGRIRVS
jgi:hypothetical protein